MKLTILATVLAAVPCAVVVLVHRQDARALRDLRAEVARLGETTDSPAPPPAVTVEREFIVGAPTPAPVESAATVEKPRLAAPSDAKDGPAPQDQLEAAFVAEVPDRQWSREAYATIASKLPSLLPTGSSVRSIECRSSICRIETQHADREGLARFTRAAFQDPATHVWNGAGMSHTERPLHDGDPMVAVAFVARPGTPLPFDPR